MRTSETLIKSKVGITRLVLLIAVLFGLSGVAWGSITACAGTMSSIQSASGNTPADGCGYANLGFSSFTSPVTGVIGTTNNATLPLNTGIDLSTTGSSVGTTSGTIDLTYTCANTTAPCTSTGFNSGNTAGSNNTLNFYTSYGAATMSGQSSFTGLITGLSLVLSIPTQTSGGTTGSNLEVYEYFCLGGTFSGTTCSTGTSNLGYLEEKVTWSTANSSATTTTYYYCAAGCTTPVSGSSPYTASFAAQSTVGIYNDVELNRVSGAGSGVVYLTSFEDQFDMGTVTPEPATLGLVGASLFGLALLRARRKRRA